MKFLFAEECRGWTQRAKGVNRSIAPLRCDDHSIDAASHTSRLSRLESMPLSTMRSSRTATPRCFERGVADLHIAIEPIAISTKINRRC
ncbi:hypothetical protein [Lysobacter capsici]|uniref:hypothetical protein n=1 Tax=Lysobacter capsici TaxID=435897 RepID=UPI00128DD0DA|nr:hypothetical protein [Lysobacter capsici]